MWIHAIIEKCLNSFPPSKFEMRVLAVFSVVVIDVHLNNADQQLFLA